VIRAIDVDDCLDLYDIFIRTNIDTTDNGNINIDAQVSHTGYAEYMWTPKIHNFLGDTALHLAMRQKKLNCIYMLIYCGANPTIENNNGERCDEMCEILFDGKSIVNLEFEAMRTILTRIHPKTFSGMPDETATEMYNTHIEDEAWMLMRQGRVMYTELPKCLSNWRDNIVIGDSLNPLLSFNMYGLIISLHLLSYTRYHLRISDYLLTISTR
jgi:hypothetical protein